MAATESLSTAKVCVRFAFYLSLRNFLVLWFVCVCVCVCVCVLVCCVCVLFFVFVFLSCDICMSVCLYV